MSQEDASSSSDCGWSTESSERTGSYTTDDLSSSSLEDDVFIGMASQEVTNKYLGKLIPLLREKIERMERMISYFIAPKVVKYHADYTLNEPDSHSSGIDIVASKEIIIPPNNQSVKIPTGLTVDFPEGVFGIILGRSGLSANQHLSISGGVIDEQFRGEVTPIMHNRGDKEYVVSRGERICQMVLFSRIDAVVERVPDIIDDKTNRGSKGFGSSGQF